MTSAIPNPDPAVRSRAWKDLSVYVLVRLLLVVVLTVAIKAVAILIESPVPLLLCALMALLIAFPLSLLIHSKLRVRVINELSEWDAQRTAHKEWVRRELEQR